MSKQRDIASSGLLLSVEPLGGIRYNTLPVVDDDSPPADTDTDDTTPGTDQDMDDGDADGTDDASDS